MRIRILIVRSACRCLFLACFSWKKAGPARKGAFSRGECLRTVATVRTADGKGQTVGRDRANAEWRFFRDDQGRFGAPWTYHAATSSAAAPVQLPSHRFRRMRRPAVAVRLGYERRPYRRAIDSRKARQTGCRECRPGKAAPAGAGAGCRPAGFQCRNSSSPSSGFRDRADPAFGAQRARIAHAARCSRRGGEQGPGKNLAVSQRAMRPGSGILPRRSNPRIPHPKLRGDWL